MTEMNEKEIHDLRVGAKLASGLPEISEEIASMIATTKNNVYAKIRSGTLTPQEALTAWMEMFSYDRLLKRFETKAALAGQVTETRSVTYGA